jgi:hypothetical protein
MNNVMVDVLEAGSAQQTAQEEEQLLERSTEQTTRLGVNLLLFAGSRSYLIK